MLAHARAAPTGTHVLGTSDTSSRFVLVTFRQIWAICAGFTFQE